MQRLPSCLLLYLLAGCLFAGAVHAQEKRASLDRGELRVHKGEPSAVPSAAASARLLPDEVEPNNTLGQAQVLPDVFPVVVNGSAEVDDVGDIIINFNDGSQDDLEDLFLVTISAAGLRVTLDGFTSDCDIYLLDGEAETILEASNTIGAQDPEEIDMPDLAAGTYLIGVTIYDAEPQGGTTTDYTMTVEGMGGGQAEMEPNNNPEQAQVLSPPFPVTVNGNVEVSDAGDLVVTFNDGSEDDLEDLFRVTTSAAGLRLSLDGFTSDCDLYLLNEAGTQILGASNTIENNEEIDMSDLAAGTYIVAVSIFDPAPGGSPTSAYTLTVQEAGGGAAPPAISHTPTSSPVPAGQPLVVSAMITDDASVANATLRYSVGGSGNATDVSMTAAGGDTFEAAIPGNDVTASGLRYQIVAEDNGGTSATLPAGGGFFSVRVRVEGGLSRSVATAGTSASAYRLVSVPLDLDNKSPAAVFEDDLGEYDTDEWRFFSLRADQEYAEFPTGTMTPGQAFWLAVSAAGQQFNTGAGTSVTLAQPHDISLNAGWTFVATPFNFSVPPEFVRLNSGETPDIRAYAGSWGTHSGPLQPFEGYAVASQGGDVLRILPNFDPAARNQSRASGGKGAVAASSRSAPAASGSNEGGSAAWAIRIAAEAGEARDTDNLAAVAAEASEGLDELDLPEPPAIGDYVRVAFPHPDWDSVFSHYSTDARPEPAQTSTTWAFAVQTNVETAVHLRFEGLASVPAAYDVWLVDEQTGAWQNLRERESYRLSGVSAAAPRQMHLVVGPHAVVQAHRQQEQALPQDFEVESYPNPFASVATVRYGLPEQGRVRLTVYNLLGERVATLVENEEQEAGYHTAVWEPQNLASGVYVYVLEAGPRRLTGKLSLVR